ncbi:hypothetical protein GAYE_SCF53G6126 [Galdieria yellowstonensis]|uniref:Metallo-beta-lactamase domain-containing protein n=1 Tax=Galdieria yellowstonensis TaxID=3028027 RepID=A0AAV9ILD0_9RHOD|nr:hypothetical protein GAYE_SCF53G6126 [Galdieria yellowstonensis]
MTLLWLVTGCFPLKSRWHLRVHIGKKVARRCIAATAAPRQRRPENVAGNIYVDTSCIDCDTCRWMAPLTFARSGEQSYVYKQPESKEEMEAALRALVSCPTGSIRLEKACKLVKQAQESFPYQVHPDLPNIFYMGFASPKSFGACSYLWLSNDSSSPMSILVDSPRFFTPLARNVQNRIAPEKVVDWMLLTHRDDVADHVKWSSYLSARRIIHSEDAIGSLQSVEWILQGEGPWYLSEDLKLVHVPGHTKGSVVLIDKKRGVAFTGDHLAFDMEVGELTAFPQVCWYSWKQQKLSVEKLMEEPVEWILPGHGRIFRFKNERERKELLGKIAKGF